MKRILALLMAMLLMVSAAALPAAAESRTGGTLIAWLMEDPSSYNIDAVSDDFATMVMENVMSKLVKFDCAGNLLPDLAASWDVSEDGLTYTFHLQQNVLWHDGVPFTSGDVLWTFQKIAAEGDGGMFLANVTNMETPDENTIVLTLSAPDAGLIYNLSWYSMYILPKHLYDGQDWLTCEAATVKPIGTGAYKFVEAQKGVSYTLEANMDYFGGVPQTDTVIYSVIGDTNTAIQAFLNGELDYLGINVMGAELQTLKDSGKATIHTWLVAQRYYAALNCTGEFTGNPVVRQALALGVDREALLTKALGGNGAVAEGFAPKAIAWAYNQDAVMPQRDTAAAIALLEGAGYTKNADGFYFTLNMPTMSASPFPELATVLKASLKEIGVDVNIISLELAAYIERLTEMHDFDLTVLSGYQGPDASALSIRVGSSGYMNFMGYASAALDEAFAAGVATTDQAERAKHYYTAQVILSQDLPILPLVEDVSNEVSAMYLSDTPLSAAGLCTPNELFTTKINK